jgi:hypothetical protein
VYTVKESFKQKTWPAGKYFFPYGPKGVGKTCMLRTALHEIPGVVEVEISGTNGSDVIVDKVLRALTHYRLTIASPYYSSKRVVFFYKCITFGRTPIIAIKIEDRANQPSASFLTELAGAVNTLTHKHQLRLAIDASPNSLPSGLLEPSNDNLFDVQPFNKSVIWNMIQLKSFLSPVSKLGLDDQIFAVLGGSVTQYTSFETRYLKTFGSKPSEGIATEPGDDKTSKPSDAEVSAFIKDYLIETVRYAILQVNSCKQDVSLNAMIQKFDKKK